MRNRLMLTVLAVSFGCVGLLRADDAPATQPTTAPSTQSSAIAPTDTEALKAKKGETVTVEGTVDHASWSTSGKVMNVVFKDVDADQGLMCSAFLKSKEKMDAAFDGDAATHWTGAKIQVTGKLEEYGGKIKKWAGRLQIVIQNPEQVKIIEPAPAQ